MLQNFLKAVAQLGDPALRGVLWIGILGSLLLFVGLWIGLWFLFAAVDASMIPGVAWLGTAFGVVFDWLAGLIYFAALISEDRRVGEECVGKCRSRWAPSN